MRLGFTRWGLLAVVLCLAPALPAGGAAAQVPSLTSAAPQATMPALVGMPREQAVGLLRQLGMEAQIGTVASARAEGTVVRQSPEAGSAVKRGGVAVLSISSGPARLPPAEPAAGQQPPAQEGGGQSDANRPRAVPDLTGMSRRLAGVRLLASGFVPGAVDSAWVPGAIGGRVVAQDPAAGRQAAPGTRVRLTLAQRTAPGGAAPVSPQAPATPVEERMTVPDLAGRSVDEARAAVGGARLLLLEVDSMAVAGARPGRVVQQRPAAGERVPPGSGVSIVVARGALVAVPALAGLPPSEARRRIQEAGLRPGGLSERDAAGPVRVLSQSPAAGSRVAPATPVSLGISRVPAIVAPIAPAAPPAAPAAVPAAPPGVDSASIAPPLAAPQAVDSARLDTVPAVVPPPPVNEQEPAIRPATPEPQPSPSPWEQWRVPGGIAALLLLVVSAGWAARRRSAAPPAAAAPVAASTVTVAMTPGSSSPAQDSAAPLAGPRVQLAIRIAPLQLAAGDGAQPLGEGRLSVGIAPSAAPEPITLGPALAEAGAVQVSIESDPPRYQTGSRAIILPEDS